MRSDIAYVIIAGHCLGRYKDPEACLSLHRTLKGAAQKHAKVQKKHKEANGWHTWLDLHIVRVADGMAVTCRTDGTEEHAYDWRNN